MSRRLEFSSLAASEFQVTKRTQLQSYGGRLCVRGHGSTPRTLFELVRLNFGRIVRASKSEQHCTSGIVIIKQSGLHQETETFEVTPVGDRATECVTG